MKKLIAAGRSTVVIALCLACVFFALVAPARADQGSLANSGGTTSAGTTLSIASDVAAPAGALSIACPIVTGQCAGGSLSFVSTDGATVLTAAFTSGTLTETCSGGGRGGHISCFYSFTGDFSGTVTTNGATQAIVGVTYQGFAWKGAAARGTTAWNSAYMPFYYSDSEQIHRSDDVQGTNQISYGGQGSGEGQFYGAYGIALDASGRIYVADTYNCRIVRIDDMSGANWTTFGGACGSDAGEFYDPSGIALDASGRIYVLDTGNSRVVRVDDMTGANWIAYGSAGGGDGQLAPYLTSLAVDAGGRIYVADTGNDRLVRFDDMTGTNWTTLTQSAPVNGVTYSFQSPVAVALDAAGRIYVADNQSYAPAVIRIDDMTGLNWTSISAGGNGLNSLSVDAGGTVLTGGGGVHLIDDMAGVIASSGSIGPIGSYYVFGVTPMPLPSPRPSAISLTPSTLDFTQNAGTAGPPQPVTISNFGGSPLSVSGVTTTGPFSATNACPAALAPGSTCTVGVSFAPTTTGPAGGALTIDDDSFNAGTSQSLPLTGTGTAPVASVSPGIVGFARQIVGTTSPARTVTLTNTGTGPLQIGSITTTGPFSQTSACAASILPGQSCLIQVVFTPASVATSTGRLTIADNAGTQAVVLVGSGLAPLVASPAMIRFGFVAVGSIGDTRTVTLSNRGGTDVLLSGPAASPGFVVVGTTCGSTIAAHSTCTADVAFSPLAKGSATGTLTFTDDAPGGPQIVSLSGYGT